MALQKSITFRGLQVQNAYYKIVGFNVQEDGVDENSAKTYRADVMVITFSDSSKEHDLEGKNHLIKGLSESGLSIASFYTALKALQDFEGATDA